MITMSIPLLFNGKKHLQKLDRIEKNEQATAKAHQKSLCSIALARESVDNLKQVLEANHISIQIHKATGNKNDFNSNPTAQ